jgi:polyisoprenyl-phosphate glycosyltransferase
MVIKLPSLSLVIPCFNEEEVLPHSINELIPLLEEWKTLIIREYQIVLVNNGSTDNTLEVMLSFKNKNNNIKIIDLRNNFGYQSSISAGLFNADNELIVSIDADLQDDPKKIEQMVILYTKGYDLVLGVRDSRKKDSFFKRIFSEGYYRFINFLGVKSVYNHGDFRLMTKELVKELQKFPEKNRYLRGLVLTLENRWAKVYYDRRKRKYGKTKFRPFHLISLGLDGITSFSIKPIRLIFLLGIVMFILAIILIGYISFLSLIKSVTVEGWTSTLIIILFFGGVQNIILGIIGEYIAKTYSETKQRPLYLVRKIYD